MMEWISSHSDVLDLAMSAVTAIVWIAYLQLLLMQFHRSKRPVILISRSAGRTSDARLFISNMGAEPIYISSLIADLELGEARATAIITENNEISADEASSISEATNEGPLGSGDYMNAGSFAAVMRRIDARAQPPVDLRKLTRITITVVALSGFSTQFAGGSRSFRVEEEDGSPVYHPETLTTQQQRGVIQRRRLRRRLERYLCEGLV